MAGVSAGAGFDFDAYSSFVYVADLDVLEQAAISLIEMYEADGTPNLANLIRQGYTRFLRELEGISRDIAKFARKRIVEIEQDTRVRPDTEGDGGERMEDYLGHSDPIPGLEGAVGINDERPLKQNVPWWWTNEEGYSGHIGREITGYFFDAGWDNPTAPDPASCGTRRAASTRCSCPARRRRPCTAIWASVEAAWGRAAARVGA
jgi:hypothetical protein